MARRKNDGGSGGRAEQSMNGGSGSRLDLRLGPEDRPGGHATGKTAKTARKPSKLQKKPKKRVKSAARRPSRASRKAVRRNGSRRSFPLRAFGFVTYWGAVAAVWTAIAVGGVMAYYAYRLPQNASFEIPARPPSIQVVAVDGTPLAQRGKMRGHAVALRDLPPVLIQAVMATEDSRFYSHVGVDPIGLTRAIIANMKAGRLVQGGSSITQQLAKNMFLTPERTVERKAQELVMAFWLEKRFTKDEILEMYLNRVYLGAGTYGVEAAAQRYFSKSAREIELPEAAILAGLLKAPSRYAPTRNPEAAAKRAGIVLTRMVDEGYITREEGSHALALPATVAQPKMASVGYVADWVAEQVESFVGEITEDVIVDTTIDAGLQQMAETALVSIMADSGAKKDASQAALVAIDGIGAVRALVGGVNYQASQYNRAVKARRQPGSAFKPFVFLAALEMGLTPDTLRIDGPTKIKGWAPKNYTGDFLGPVNLSYGLSRSLNTIAARLAHEVSPATVAHTARRLGVTSTLHENPSIALGTAEVSLLELTGAYVPFANGGFGALPHVIRRIKTRDGAILYERTGSGPGAVVDGRTLGAFNYMMAKTVTEGTGKAARLETWPAAGKTGTTQGFKDAWFVGYTANLTAGVWVGNDDGKPTRKATGGNVPAHIWNAFMKDAHAGLPPLALPGHYDPEVGQRHLPADETLPWLRDKPDQRAAEVSTVETVPVVSPIALDPGAQRAPVAYDEPRQGGMGIAPGFLRRIFAGG